MSEASAHQVRRSLGHLSPRGSSTGTWRHPPRRLGSSHSDAVELPGEVRLSLLDQDGVIARRQAMALAVTKSDIDRLVRRREWMRVLPGVNVDHTGEPTWLQRAWAGPRWPAHPR